MSKNSQKKSKKGLFAIIAGALGLTALAAHTVKKKKDEEAAAPLTLFSDGATAFSVVFNHERDSHRLEKGGAVDYEVQLAKILSEALEAATGIPFPLKDDQLPEGGDAGEAFEILIGDTSRTESAALRGFLGFNEYGFAVLGNKIVVAGSNLTSTAYAVKLFTDYVTEHTLTDVLGNKYLTLDADEQQFATADEWFVDIPEFEGGTYRGTHDDDLGALMLHYTDTDADAFRAYREKLEAAGYALWQENEIEGNLYATYESDKAKVYISFTACEGAVRIVTAKAGEYHLPISTPDTGYEKVADTTITQLACDYTRHDYGMGYIVVLENGNFVIFDGGDNRNTNTFMDLLYEKLQALNKRPDGKIVIEGWFISHNHPDHYGTFVEFCYKYGKEVTILQVLLNTTSNGYEYNSVSWDRSLQTYMGKISDSVAGGVRFVQVHTGMKINLCNASFEILHTTEDLYPQLPFYFNDTSIVWRMFVGGESSIWLGDLAQRGSGVMLAKFGAYLKSDIVQVSHHGYVGATVELYDAIDAPIALWPINKVWYDKMIAPEFTYYKENIEVVKHARENLIAEEDIVLSLPYYNK